MAVLTEIGMFSSEMEAEFLTCEAEFSTTTAPGEEMSQDAGTSEHELEGEDNCSASESESTSGDVSETGCS